MNDRIGYESQLIVAVINTRSGIKGRLEYFYEGTGEEMTCTVKGEVDGQALSYTSPPISLINPKNSPLWKTDPMQQLGYYSARSWARKHVPEVILGVYDRDEAAQFQGPDRARDVTPSAAAQKYSEPKSEEKTDGFDLDNVEKEIDGLTGSADLVDSAVSEQGDADEPTPQKSASPTSLSDEEKKLLRGFKGQLWYCLSLPEREANEKLEAARDVKIDWRDNHLNDASEAVKAAANEIYNSFLAILNGKVKHHTADSFFEEMLGKDDE